MITSFLLAAVAASPAVDVKAASRAGSGCPATQTVDAKVDGDTLTVDVPAFTAEAGANALSRKNCDVIVQLAWPAGWQVSPVEFTAELEAHVPPGAKADATYKVYYQGQADTDTVVKPLAGDVAAHAEAFALKESWSACGTGVGLVQGLALRVVKDGKASVTKAGTLKLKWRKC